MSIVVQKFGGSSVRDAAHMRRAAERIAEAYRSENDVIAVLSAQGSNTDRLLALAEEVNPRAHGRELDMLLATGEQASVALCAMTLEQMGVPSVSFCGWQAGILTDSVYGSAAIRRIRRERIDDAHRKGKVALVAGFQGMDDGGNITTLGRGGSDTSAVALAACFGAADCFIFTDVDGVYTADPRFCPQARHRDAVSYGDMLLLSQYGAQVLHDRSVALAQEKRVPVTVLSCSQESRRSVIGDVPDRTGFLGVTQKREGDGVRVCVVLRPQPTGETEKTVAAALCENGIAVRETRISPYAVSVLLAREDAEKAVLLLHEAFGTETAD